MTRSTHRLSRCPHGVRRLDPNGCDACYDDQRRIDADLAKQPRPVRVHLPDTRESMSRTFQLRHVVEAGPPPVVTMVRWTATVSFYPGEHGALGELFIAWDVGSEHLAGLSDGLAIAISYAAQYGVPLRPLLLKFVATRFPPCGRTIAPNCSGEGWSADPLCPEALSPLDYLARWLLDLLHARGIEPRGELETV